MRPHDAWCWAALLLLALLCDGAGGRRGRAGARPGAFGPVSRGGGRSGGRGSKVAGAIAAGAAAGYGMGLLGRPRPARPGPGAAAARQPAGGFQAPSWRDASAKRGPPSRAGERAGAGGTALLLLPPALCLAGLRR
ncbi:shadow of prion protein [Rhea pennata]|uniref:shadow of prion protein n=1 Tax=Rhea pennata TaxID=8795 RepID=UPI002E254206